MCNCEKRERQTHVHEFLGSTRLAEIQTEPHNHRFAGVSGQAIRSGNSHVHRITTNTDFFDHFHMINVLSGPAIPVGMVDTCILYLVLQALMMVIGMNLFCNTN